MPKFLNPITITTPSGSAPLIVNSSTVVTNLNADLLDGQHGSYYQNAGNLNAGTVPLARLSGSYNIDITGSSAFVFVNDTRSSVTGPQTGYRQVRADFLANSTDGLSDGGTYHGVLTFQQWADSSGGGTRQLAFTDNDNLWLRGSGGALTAYGSWKLMLNSVNYSSYALPLTGGTLTGSLTGTSASFGGLVTIDNSTPADILRLKSGGSTVWKFGVTDASGSYLNITADYGNVTIYKLNGNITTPGAFVSTVATGTAPLSVTSTTAVTNLNADYLDGQHGSYYENRDTTAVGFSGGTLTLTRASGNLTASLDGRYLPLAGGTLTGALVGLAATFSGATNLSGGLTVSSSTYNVFNKPTTNNYQTVSLFGSTSGGLFLTTDSPIISTGAYYNNGWITTATSGTWMNFAGGGFDWSTFSGATIGTAPTWVSRMTMSAAGVLNVPGSITQAGNQVVHAGNVSTYALPIGGGTLAGNLTINGNLTMGSGYQHRASDGSAAAPGYSFNADTDTGIYRSANNTLAFATAGVARATISDAGLFNVFGNAVTNGATGFGNRNLRYSYFHGGAQDLAWKKIADITLGTALYSACAFQVEVIDAGSNFGHQADCKPMVFYAACRRSMGTANVPNDAIVYGPIADYVRVAKTATGVYELQIRQIADWLNHIFIAEVVSYGDATVTYVTGTPANGSTTGTNYTATAGWTQRFPNLSVTSAATVGGTLGVTGVATFASAATFSAASGTYINTGGGTDAFGYNATSGYGHYIKGTGNTYIYGGGVFWDGSAIRTLLHSNNYSSYALPLSGGTMTGDLTATRIRGVNSLVLNTFTTVNPASNVFLYSQPNDRDAWIFLDSADTGSNWGIYHRQIDSAVSGLPANSIGFIGGGSSALQAWISLANGSAGFTGTVSAGSFSGPGTGLTGTAASLSIGGNAATASSATRLTNLTSTTTSSAGTDNSESCISYINGISLFGQTDGALYSHVYSASWKHNIYGDYRTGQIAVRGKNNGTWQAWRAVLDSSNVSTYALPIGGGTLTGALTGTTAAFSGAITQGGNPVLSESVVTFTPTTVGWYRIANAGGNSSGTIRISGFYDNRSAVLEFDYTVNGWNQGCSINLRNNNTYAGSLITQIRASNDVSTANGYLDIYIATATTPGPLTIYNFGPARASLVASPVVGAVVGTNVVKIANINNVMGFVTTGPINADTMAIAGNGTIGGTLGVTGLASFTANESINAKGIRGQFTNEYLHLYNKVGIGHPGGWGQGEGSTPDKGLSTYGGINVAYGNSATSTFNGAVNVTGALTQSNNQVLHAGNYIGSYIAPQTNYTTVVDASGYTWIRIPYAQGDSFNGGQSPIEFYVTRSIYDNSSTPYGGPTAKFVIQSMEWHSGQQMGTVQYGERGDSSSLGASNWITHAKVTNLSGGGYWVYLRLRTTTTAGVTYMFRRAAVGGQGINFSAIESTTDPGGAARLYYGFNLISAGTEARFYRDGNQVIDAGGFSGSLAVGYGSFASPGITLGDAQYGLYVTGGNLYYKSASGGVHYWRNIANSANTMSLDNSGNLVAAGSVTGSSFSGAGTGLTGTAASLSIGGNAATATSSPWLSALANYVWSHSTLPTGYNQGIQASFVSGGQGWQNYGSVVTVNTYSGGGGALQLYVPYSPSYGGTGLQVRFGNYDVSSGNSWTSWKTLLASDNYSSYALPLTGGTLTGTLLVAPGNIAVNSLSDGYIGIGDPSHTVGWGVAQGIAGRTGDCVWAFGSNGGTGNNDTWYFGIGSAANTTFGTAFSITQNRKVNFQNGVDVVYGALTQGGNQVLHAGNYTSYRGNQLLSPNGGTVVAADSAMPDAANSFIHTLGFGPSGNDGHILGMTWTGTSVYGAQIWIDTDPTNRMAFRSRSNVGVWTGWNEIIHSSNYSSYALPLSGGTLTGALSGTSASFSGALTSGGNSVLTVGNYSSYAVDNTKRFKQFFWDGLSASTTQARRFEIARISVDTANWNATGTFEVEVSDTYYDRGLKKRYVVWYGYNIPKSGIKLVEMIGAGDNNYQVTIGTPQPITGNQYYLPVYVEVRYYGIAAVRVKTTHQITSNSTPPVGYAYINSSPTPTNITDFTADSTVDLSNAATAWLVGGNTLLQSANYTNYTLPRGGSWYGVNLPGSRWGGFSANGGEIVFGQDLPNTGQMGVLIDGCYIAGENNGFWSLASSNDWTTRRGMYFDGTYLRFDYNSATAYFSNASINGNQVLHASNYNSYALPLSGGTVTGTLAINGGDCLRVFKGGASSVTSHIYWANTGNTIAYNWQLDENNNAAMWGYGGTAWAKLLTVTAAGALTAASSITASSFSGAGTGLTGTASSLTAGAVPWSGITSKPTTFSGYGISDIAYGSTGSRNVWTITDWNQTTYQNAHFLSSENTHTNGPSSDFIYGLQTSFHRSGAAYRTQMVTELYSSPVSIWVRNSRDSDVWTTWSKLLHSNNYTDYAPTKTGTGASGSWGINITGSSASCTGNAATCTTANGIADGTVSTTAKLANSVVTYAKIQNVGSSSVLGNPSASVSQAPQEITFANLGTYINGVARAWVTFNENPSTGAITINASFGISSVTRLAAGVYQVNFSTAFSDTHYAVSGTIGYESISAYTNGGYLGLTRTANPKTTTSCEVAALYGGTNYNARYVHVVFHR